MHQKVSSKALFQKTDGMEIFGDFIRFKNLLGTELDHHTAHLIHDSRRVSVDFVPLCRCGPEKPTGGSIERPDRL